MRIRFKALIVGLLSAVLIVGGGNAALATTVYPPEGGVWNYDSAAATIWSQYLHPTSNHRTSVRDCNGFLTRSAVRPGGAWANVTAPGCVYGVDYAYYAVV